MIDSQGRGSSAEEAVTTSSDSQMAPVDQYAFVDETGTTGYSKSAETRLPVKRGLKRTFEDLIKCDSFSTSLSSDGSLMQSALENIDPNSSCSGPRGNRNVESLEENVSSVSTPNPNTADAESDRSLCSSDVNRTTVWTETSLDSNNNSSNTSSSSSSSSGSNIDNSSITSNISSNNTGTRGSSRRGRAYGLRPRTSIRRSVDDRESPERPGRKIGRRGRGRGNTLSKYRRNTANARERDRMSEINTAFATLRGVLPSFACRRISSMTKITTLKLATSYIRALADLLKDPPQETPPNLQYLSSQLSSSPSTSGSVLHSQLSGSLSLRHHETEGTGSLEGRGQAGMGGCGGERRTEGCAIEGQGEGCESGRLEGRVEGRWWSTVESDVLQALDTDITWDDLALSDLCWSMS